MNKLFDISLPVNVLREGDKFIAYTPALELSTQGNTFEEAVLIFFEEIMQEGKMENALNNLGWVQARNKFIPPTMVSTQNETFSIPLTQ